MNRRALFLTSALTGLTCGFLFRWGTGKAGDSFFLFSARRSEEVLPEKKEWPLTPEAQGVREWESRLAKYLDGPVPLSPGTGQVAGPLAEADTALRLLRQPVSAASIGEGVALLNAAGPSRYATLMAAVFERWAHEAPDAALAAAPGLREPMVKAALVWKVFAASAGEPDIIAKAMRQPPGVLREAAFAALAEAVPPERVPEVLRESMRNSPPPKGPDPASFQTALFQKLGQADREAPLRLALETEDPAWRTALLKMVYIGGHGMTVYAVKPQELARDPRNLEGLTDALWEELHFRPEGRNEILAVLPETQRRELLVRELGFSMGCLTDDQYKNQDNNPGLESLLNETKQKEGPEGFRALLAESALVRGAQGLEEAARWLATRQTPAEIGDLTRRAALAEPFTTARWLAGMPPSPERDRAVAVFAETHAAVDPESAAVWAESITDLAKRESALSAVRKNTARQQ